MTEYPYYATEFQGKPDIENETPNETILNINNIPTSTWIMIAAGAVTSNNHSFHHPVHSQKETR